MVVSGRGLNRRLSDHSFKGLIIDRSQRLFRLLFPLWGEMDCKGTNKIRSGRTEGKDKLRILRFFNFLLRFSPLFDAQQVVY